MFLLQGHSILVTGVLKEPCITSKKFPWQAIVCIIACFYFCYRVKLVAPAQSSACTFPSAHVWFAGRLSFLLHSLWHILRWWNFIKWGCFDNNLVICSPLPRLWTPRPRNVVWNLHDWHPLAYVLCVCYGGSCPIFSVSYHFILFVWLFREPLPLLLAPVGSLLRGLCYRPRKVWSGGPAITVGLG